MTKNKKILVGLGVAALVVYVYTRMGKKAQTPTSQPQSESGGMQSNSNPYLIGGGIAGGIKLPSKEPSVIPSNRVYSNYYGGMMDSKEEVESFEIAYKKKYSYKVHCSEINKKPCGKMDFVSKLSEIQINYYKVSLETLKTIADKNKWINDLDEYDVVEEEIEVENPLDNGVDLSETKKIKKIKKVVAITEK